MAPTREYKSYLITLQARELPLNSDPDKGRGRWRVRGES